MTLVGLALLAWSLMLIIASLAVRLGCAWARHRAEGWSRRPHPCRWRARGVMGWRDGATLIVEECALCPSVRLAERDGLWIANRLGELVNAGDVGDLRRMLGGTGHAR